MTNRSTFPNTIDSFNYLSEVLSSDKLTIDRYKTLLMQETRTTSEETELTNLKTTLYNAGKLVSSESFNKIFDCMTNLEDYFLNTVMEDLKTLDVGVLRTDLGLPDNLTTADKNSLVNAINELNSTKMPNSRNIFAGSGLTGGGILSTDRTISVLYGGNGVATSVSRSDHTHDDAWTTQNFDPSTKANTTQMTSIDATLQNGWQNAYSDQHARYWKDDFRMVHINGRVKLGTRTDGTIIFTLPSGYRPKDTYYENKRGMDIQILTTGEVKIYNCVSNADNGIDNVHFRAL